MATRPPEQEQWLAAVLLLLVAAGVGSALLFALDRREMVELEHDVVVAPNLSRSTERPAVAPRPSLGAMSADPLAYAIADGLDLVPVMVGQQVQGYAIAASSDGRTLQRLNLKVGDLIIELDDARLDAARLTNIGEELILLDRVEILYRRDGLERSEIVDLTR